jgi:SAM-dependent methyltransferase
MANNGYLEHTTFADSLSLKRLNLIIEEVSNHAKESTQDKLDILELGCGIGGISFPLASLGHAVLGTDLDEKSIERCSEKNNFSNASYQVGDAETLDLPEKVDVVVASELIEHCPNPELVLQTVKRLLKDDGIGIVTIPNGYCLYEITFSRIFQKLGLLNLFHKLPKGIYKRLTGSPSPYHSENVFCNHVQFFTLRKFKRLLNNCGLQASEVHNLSLGLLLDWKWLSPLKRIECKLADYAPHPFAGGWVFQVRSNGKT